MSKSNIVKNGEQEAKTIMETFGYSFNEKYHDDNSKTNMPDFKYADGRYLEVTHTKHNNRLFSDISKFSKKTIDEQLKIMNEAHEAYERYQNCDYKCGPDDQLTTEGKIKYLQDLKLLKEHYGYTPEDREHPFSEFNCDIPIIECGSDQVLWEIVHDKGEIYKGRKDVDLFVFITDSEFESVVHLLQSVQWNGAAQGFLMQISQTSFEKVILCVWNIEKQQYNIINPKMIEISKMIDGNALLHWRYHNCGNSNSDNA